MARIGLASCYKSMHGRRGNMVLYNYCGRQYARSHVVPRNPNTEAQVFVRRTFGDAVHAWQALGDDEKHRFNRKGRMRSMKGYNLFISEYMKERMPGLRSGNNENNFPVSSRPSSPGLLRCSSVPAPLSLHQGPISPPVSRIRDKIPA